MDIFLRIIKIFLVGVVFMCIVLISLYFYLKSDYFYKNKFEEISNLDFPDNGGVLEKSARILSPHSVKFVINIAEEDFKRLENEVKSNDEFIIFNKEVRCYKDLKTIFIANYKNEENKTFKTVSFCDDYKTVFVSGGYYR